MIFKRFSILLLFITSFVFAQQENKKIEIPSEEISITPLIDGTLLLPESDKPLPLAIIIAGSGPTDRDGNQPMMKNNSLKFLAEGLSQKNIATFRYDKRIVKQIQIRNVDERKARFDHFIDDAMAILEHFSSDDRFSKIYFIGHSQGSLIGMVAAQNGADGFVSIAGAGQEIDNIVVDQLAQQAPYLQENARQAFDEMKTNGVSKNFDPVLASIFREEIQPFMLSWMKYDPIKEIKKLDIPVLIINGDKDIQVKNSEAELLYKARPDAEFHIIPNMNHVLKHVEDMGLENQKSYTIHDLPVVPELIETIQKFINSRE